MSKVIENAQKFFGEVEVTVDSEATTLPNLYKDTIEGNGLVYEDVEKVNSFNRDFINNSATMSLEAAEKFIADFDGNVESVDVFIPMGEHSNLTHSIHAGKVGETEEESTVGSIVSVYETVHDSDTFDHLVEKAEAIFQSALEEEEAEEEAE